MSDMRRAECLPWRHRAGVAGLVGLVLFGSPPPDSPFDEPVGGPELGTAGMPVVSAGAPPVPLIDATAWLLADLRSRDVLAALNAHEPRPPASTIKLLTALAVLAHVDPDERYTATDADARSPGSRVGLVPGEEYSVADLQHGLLLASGNDAAHALATLVVIDGSATSLMNDEAARLGAFDTHATTPDGMDAPGQVSSAYDLALIGRAVLADEELASLVRTPSYDFPGLDGETFQIQNHNRLLGSYEGTIGLKTGFTSLAGHTVVAAAERGDAALLVVILGAKGRAEAGAQALLDWGFAAREDAEAVGTLVTRAEVADAGARQDDTTTAPRGGSAAGVDDAVGPPSAVPGWAWAGLLLVPLGVTLGLAWRKRRRGRPAAT